MQAAHVNPPANIPNASEERWSLWVPNFVWKGHRQMWAINILVLQLVWYPLLKIPSTQPAVLNLYRVSFPGFTIQARCLEYKKVWGTEMGVICRENRTVNNTITLYL